MCKVSGQQAAARWGRSITASTAIEGKASPSSPSNFEDSNCALSLVISAKVTAVEKSPTLKASEWEVSVSTTFLTEVVGLMT